MSIENRPEYKAAAIQAEVDDKLSPERAQAALMYRERILTRSAEWMGRVAAAVAFHEPGFRDEVVS